GGSRRARSCSVPRSPRAVTPRSRASARPRMAQLLHIRYPRRLEPPSLGGPQATTEQLGRQKGSPGSPESCPYLFPPGGFRPPKPFGAAVATRAAGKKKRRHPVDAAVR